VRIGRPPVACAEAAKLLGLIEAAFDAVTLLIAVDRRSCEAVSSAATTLRQITLKVTVSAQSYLLVEEQGEMYFCNARYLCLWAVHFVTCPHRPEE